MNGINLEILNERIQTQIQVQEKYSQAFIQILELLEQIKEQVEINERGPINELIRQISELIDNTNNNTIHIKKTQEDIENLIKDTTNSINTRISEYKTEISKLVEELYLQRHYAEDVMPNIEKINQKSDSKLNDILKNIQDSINIINNNAKENIDSGFRKNEIKHNEMLKKLSSIFSVLQIEQDNKKEILKKVFIYGAAIVSLISFLGFLAKIGLITIIFGSNFRL